MLIKTGPTDRRRVLRGILGGAGVAVTLPFLDLFLNDSGTAMATEAPLPTRFGTWFWGLGMEKTIFVPTKYGSDYDLPDQIATLSDVRDYINIYNNYNLVTDGRPNLCHFTGWVSIRCGRAPNTRTDLPSQTFDVPIADVIGNTTRFRMINAAATGVPADSYSFTSGDAYNIPETSAVALYQKLFGADFQDPNTADFKPNPAIMMRQSVLSAVGDERKSLERSLGASDRARLDEYFTAVRDLEGRLEVQLQKPPACPDCSVPTQAPADVAPSPDVDIVDARHDAMADLIVMALSCNQTRVFNLAYSASASGMVRKGHEETHHVATHEEPTDPKLGYQPTNDWFLRRSMASWGNLVRKLANKREGDGCLLDRTLVFAHSDTSLAKTHNIDGIPMFTAGRAGGLVKSGLHIDGKGTPATRLGLTMQQIMGVQVSQWGEQSLKTSQPVTEILT